MEAEPDSNTLICNCNLDDGQVPKEKGHECDTKLSKPNRNETIVTSHLSAFRTCETVIIHWVHDFNVRPS